MVDDVKRDDDQRPVDQSGDDPGVPGGGKGRKDEPGRTGIFPLSQSADADPSAPIISEGALGQGERGVKGYDDSGDSEMALDDVDAPSPNTESQPS
ncbi:MAG TPA: hypothetical protein VKB76_15635 [Ktedonobacterales bacterium]|nr:hypothetical protein [Ktedonobacterales bacterium]